MSLHRNRVQMTVAGAPGTGTITLNAATSGYQSFSSAYGADATVDILITENANWEVCRNCAYTNGTPQVTRGTLEGSSAGPTTRVSFGSGAIVSVIATAASGNNWGLNEIQASPTGAGVTGVVGTMHILDISGLTADRDFTLPATCAVGDRVGVFLKAGDADYELLLKPASGDTINGGSPAAEWSRLFISNECVVFRCITADTDWIVEYDGRIVPAVLVSSNAATTQTLTRNAVTHVVAALADEVTDTANEWDNTNKIYYPRRNGLYQIFCAVQMNSIQSDKAVQILVRKNNSTTVIAGQVVYATANNQNLSSVAAGVVDMNGTSDDIRVEMFYEDATTNRATLAGAGRCVFQANWLR